MAIPFVMQPFKQRSIDAHYDVALKAFQLAKKRKKAFRFWAKSRKIGLPNGLSSKMKWSILPGFHISRFSPRRSSTTTEYPESWEKGGVPDLLAANPKSSPHKPG
jgi:hypothetical protein